MAKKEISLREGKYNFFETDMDTLACHRYGEVWRDFIGDNAVRALFDHAIELQADLDLVYDFLSEGEAFNDFVEWSAEQKDA